MLFGSLTQSQAQQTHGARQNIEEGDLERSSLVQHTFEQKGRIVWKKTKILEMLTNSLKENERKRPTCYVYKIPSVDPALNFRSSGAL